MPVPFLGRAIRRRHSAVDEERGGRVVARHILQNIDITAVPSDAQHLFPGLHIFIQLIVIVFN